MRWGLEVQLVALCWHILLARAPPIPWLKRAQRGSHERASRPPVPRAGLEWVAASQVIVGTGGLGGDMFKGRYILKCEKILHEFRVDTKCYGWKRGKGGKNPAAQWKQSPDAQMRMPGVEPGSQAWEACMIPLHYMRLGQQSLSKQCKSENMFCCC